MATREEDLVAELIKLGYQVTPPEPKPKPDRCATCGAVSESTVDYYQDLYDLSEVPDDAYVCEWLTEIDVWTNPNEEGRDHVRLFFCDRHDTQVLSTLMGLGFKSHRHGGTAYLQDKTCPGDKNMRACPHWGEDDDA